ncbi:hypothetical protein DVH24_002299 [Malus domestica]|uniref:TsaA-like domain-containing protein n=1 Tax=Malus domestica TaxID=3750 RepID=A0A498IB35_MALDO|nr:hypothetical protein DVH24_002299 [Malus domestica]
MAYSYSTDESKWLRATITFALVALSASTAFSLYLLKRKSRDLDSKIGELQKSLKASSDICGAERQGRIRAQQALREALTQPKLDSLELTSYPMAPIGVVQSCFSTRNGTPRQPLLVPLSRACLIFNSARVPPASLEGLGEYSHCWVIYVFHLNTNLEKLWKDPTTSRFKAKVRVPRLNGERRGVFATRSPHRPCPIGLTVAKVQGSKTQSPFPHFFLGLQGAGRGCTHMLQGGAAPIYYKANYFTFLTLLFTLQVPFRHLEKWREVEAVHRSMLLLSGVDLVDGTPVLDVKPYLPYSDSIQGARVPKWLTPYPHFMERLLPSLEPETYRSWAKALAIAPSATSLFSLTDTWTKTFKYLLWKTAYGDSVLAVASVSFSEGFTSTLADCWEISGKNSLYASPDQFQNLIKQVLSWDIRSLSQRNRPHDSFTKSENGKQLNECSDDYPGEEASSPGSEQPPQSPRDIIYHLTLEGLDVSYRLNCDGSVVVEKVTEASSVTNSSQKRCNYSTWKDHFVPLEN